ncbi:serine/threonine protein kinase Ppk25 [Schizosaccharomyces osmophilus]|uniref:non-specific serine/threonine protein kinase n=1 Tax=Schizosaccharomyces osmophilus TaxID=2545709 RepID=A0AAE9WB18_9SCHI|nr:serine/threonine protein kinase Ppk25 [Schizosaccharomyces osmophilus]WBW72354.1 serine/threonine protein kinase Ppk25 [Schizosaccharomyces osmophilus]
MKLPPLVENYSSESFAVPRKPTLSKIDTLSRHQKSTSGYVGTAGPGRRIGNWIIKRTIGSGSMGKVKLAIHTITGEKAAMKMIPITPANTKQTVRIQREALLGRVLRHPNICPVVETIKTPTCTYILFEYIGGGQLLEYILANGRLDEGIARLFMIQLLDALRYLHQNLIVHRDLKIENILLTEDLRQVKLIDFGLSNFYSQTDLLQTYCGSLYFAAPELLDAVPYTGPEVDVWSLGVVLYVMVCGRVPFDDVSVPMLHSKIKSGKIEFPSYLSSECRVLMSAMLNVDPKKRIPLEQTSRFPWFKQSSFCNYLSPLMSSSFPGISSIRSSMLKPPFNIKVLQLLHDHGFSSIPELKHELFMAYTERKTTPLVCLYILGIESFAPTLQIPKALPPVHSRY